MHNGGKEMTHMSAIILAAGKGTRMNSDMPKVLHQISHRSMLDYVIRSAADADIRDICLVVGHGAEQVQAAMGDRYQYALQQPQLGTGHAVQQAIPQISADIDAVMILCGDTPLLTAATLRRLKEHFTHSTAACTVLTAVLPDGGKYGRILRGANGDVEAIVEYADADESELQIREVNSGVYCFDLAILQQMLVKIKPDNAQGEYYLTDVIKEMHAEGKLVNAFVCEDAEEIAGVNDRQQLAEAAKTIRCRKNAQLMLSGVTMVDPDTVYIDDSVEIEPDCLIEPHVYIEGNCRIGSGCHIGPSVKIADSLIGDDCEIGPFCYLRPGTVLENKVKAGHFVEIKKSHIGIGSKVPHLTYIGDAEIGEEVNIGCGTITCNYDGKNKHQTIIEDQAFIGSNTNLVAPVKVGKRATIAAGSTITKDVPEDSLGIARGRQSNVDEWALTRDPRFSKKHHK
jgi:bifunctional UDP-N-acetylglucosamine pyrophosphorylase/glucosamine-1-phosphate N-acetyltransferase